MIREWADGFIAPMYDFFGAMLPFIIGLIVLFIILYFLNKIRYLIKSKLIRNYKVGSTNNWFSWDEYYDYLGDKERKIK